jgi:hypothetical protein
MDRFAPSPSLGQLLAQRGLNTYFDEAVEALRNSPELQKIHSAGSDAVFELRRAIARGLLAYTIAAAEEAGELPVDGRTRDDELMLRLGSELRTEGRGLSSLITAVPRRVASGAAVRRRGLLSDRGMATSGDVLRYQVHGEGLRRLIRNVVEDAPGDAVTLVGHSLGGVACFDLLVLDQIPRVDRLLTVGSQAPYLYEIGALASLSYPSPLPLHFPEDWLNVYDPNDLLAYVGRELFGDRVRDSQIDNRQPFPQAHSAYWNNDDFWKVVSPWAR